MLCAVAGGGVSVSSLIVGWWGDEKRRVLVGWVLMVAVEWFTTEKGGKIGKRYCLVGIAYLVVSKPYPLFFFFKTYFRYVPTCTHAYPKHTCTQCIPNTDTLSKSMYPCFTNYHLEHPPFPKL